MRNEESMSNLTESLPLKISMEDRVGLAKIAHARGDNTQNVAREFIRAGIAKTIHEYTVAARLLRGEEIVSESRGKKR